MNKSELNGAEKSRRSFLKQSIAATATFAAADFTLLAAPPVVDEMNREHANQAEAPGIAASRDGDRSTSPRSIRRDTTFPGGVGSGKKPVPRAL